MQNNWNFIVGKSSLQEMANFGNYPWDFRLWEILYCPKSGVSWIIQESWQPFKGHLSTTAIAYNRQCIHRLLFKTSLQWPLFFCPQGDHCREVQLYIKLLVIANVHNTKNLPLSFQVNINGILIGADSYASVLLAHCAIECLYGKLFITIQCHAGC